MHEPLPIPASVAAQLEDWTATFEYSYGPETATWRLHCGGQRRYLKVARLGGETSLASERDRMRWAVHRLSVPQIVGYGTTDGVEWLLTEALPGVTSTQEEMIREPTSLVPMLAQGLRNFHHTPTQDCPFSFRLDQALAHVRGRVDTGLIDPVRDFHPEHRHFTPRGLWRSLRLQHPSPRTLSYVTGTIAYPTS